MQETDTGVAHTAIPTQTTTQTAAPVTSEHKKTGVGSFVADLAVTAVIAAIAAFAVLRFAPQLLDDKPQAQRFAIVDMQKLSNEHILGLTERVRAGDIEVGDMTKKTTEFAQALMDRMQALSQEGVIVLKSDAVASVPANVQDLTQTLREQLQAAGQMQRRDKK